MLRGILDCLWRLQGFCKCLIVTVVEAEDIAVILLLNLPVTGLVLTGGI